MHARRGLVDAAAEFAADDLEQLCARFDQWQLLQGRELPWLAGPVFTVLNRIAVNPPNGPDIRVLERFLVGAEARPVQVRQAMDRCMADAGSPGPPLPPDVRGAMVDAVERFFELLARAHREIGQAIRSDDPAAVESLVEQWQDRLDEAATDADHRAEALLGLHARPQSRGRGATDRSGLAIAFVLLAVVTAALVFWLVTRGWPVTPLQLRL